VNGQDKDLAAARHAIAARDFAALAELAEHSCLKMHAAAMAALPPLVYWNGVTVECMLRVRSLRRRGVPVFFTIDAGPQLKAVCEPAASREVAALLAAVPGVLDVLVTGLGPGLTSG
jgi:diphosphomevalonate decarboxylase